MSDSFADDLLKGLRQVSFAFKRQNIAEPHTIIVPAPTLSYMNCILPGELCATYQHRPTLNPRHAKSLTLMGYEFLALDKFNATQTMAAITALHEINNALQKFNLSRQR